MCDACGIQLQLHVENISRVQTRLGSKTETDFHRSSWRTIEILHGLGIGSWSPSWASGFTTTNSVASWRTTIHGSHSLAILRPAGSLRPEKATSPATWAALSVALAVPRHTLQNGGKKKCWSAHSIALAALRHDTSFGLTTPRTVIAKQSPIAQRPGAMNELLRL